MRDRCKTIFMMYCLSCFYSVICAMKKPTGTTSLFDIVSEVRAVIETVYMKGSAPTGRQSYDGLMLFKIELLRVWCDLSDEGV